MRRDTYPSRPRLRRKRSPPSPRTASHSESLSLFLPALAQTRAQILRDVVEKLNDVKREHSRAMDDGDVEPACDEDLAKAAARVLKADDFVPFEDLDLSVSNGRITLRGRVEWQYQKDDAERIVGRLRGVKRVRNLITVSGARASSLAR